MEHRPVLLHRAAAANWASSRWQWESVRVMLGNGEDDSFEAGSDGDFFQEGGEDGLAVGD